MLIKGNNGMYNRQRCANCGELDKQDYLILADLGHGNIQHVHPIAEGRCNVAVEHVYPSGPMKPYHGGARRKMKPLRI